MATFVEQTQASIAENVAAVAEYRCYAAAHPGDQLAEELLRCVAVIVTRLRARREVYVACGWQDVADMFTQGIELCGAVAQLALNIPIAGGALLFPYAVEVDEARVKVAKSACRVCFPDGRVDHIGFVVSPRGTIHIPMFDGDTVCCHDMQAGGWWAHDVVGGQGVGRTIRKFAAKREP